ncbi:MAG: hypothetical protein EOO72_00130 [Myxococcaceae bacterium]|nr:MAG: hypothetical protein EOO72_00130 [Myxococcaceae bacterium]
MKTRTSPLPHVRGGSQRRTIQDLDVARYLHAERRLGDIPLAFGRVYLGHNRDTGLPFIAQLPMPTQKLSYPRAEMHLVLTTSVDPPGMVLEVVKAPQGLSRDSAEEEVRAVLSDMTELLDGVMDRPEVMDCLLGPPKHFRRRTAAKQRSRAKRLALYAVGGVLALAVVLLGALCSAFNFALAMLPYLAR